MDLEITSPSDYTLHVTGLDRNYDSEELKKHFENCGRRDNKKAEVVKVLKLYNVGEFIELEREMGKLQA